MRVAMVTGNKDYGSYTIENDVRVLQKCGSDVSVQSFEGGHQAAPASVMTKAFRWLSRKLSDQSISGKFPFDFTHWFVELICVEKPAVAFVGPAPAFGLWILW